MSNDNPQTGKEYFVRGNKRREDGDFDGAIADYTESLRLNPDNIAALNNRGAAHNEKGEHEKAIHDLSKVIHLNPNLIDVWVNRGNVWAEKKASMTKPSMIITKLSV